MRLTRSQLQHVLQAPLFSTPVGHNSVEYTLFRGRTAVTVHTVRFNQVETLSVQDIANRLIALLETWFIPHSTVLGSIQYDLLLCHFSEESYYVWRANSNQNTFDEAEETIFLLNPVNIFRLAQRALSINVARLNANFRHSKVNVQRPLAVVFSFMQI